MVLDVLQQLSHAFIELKMSHPTRDDSFLYKESKVACSIPCAIELMNKNSRLWDNFAKNNPPNPLKKKPIKDADYTVFRCTITEDTGDVLAQRYGLSHLLV